eukprot:7379766-Prymnesium_polylepis.1
MLDDVKKVQKLMNDMAVAGTPDGGEPPAGDFQYLQTQLAKDPEGFLKTVERINGAPFGNSGSTKALQRLLGIKADGFFGARPWIERWVAHHLESSSCARCSLTHHLVCFVLAGTFSVKALQNWCNLEGATRWGDDWVTCSVDGVWGPKTATAMQKVISSKEVEFQKVFSNMFVSGHFGKQSKIALQAFLKMRDVYHDPVNGDFGERAQHLHSWEPRRKALCGTLSATIVCRFSRSVHFCGRSADMDQPAGQGPRREHRKPRKGAAVRIAFRVHAFRAPPTGPLVTERRVGAQRHGH